MKKHLFILIAVFGLCFYANADKICRITKGVEPTIMCNHSNSNYVAVKLANTNDYKVTVDVTINLVLKDGKKKEIKRTRVLKAKPSGEYTTSETIINTTIPFSNIDENASSVDILVTQCD